MVCYTCCYKTSTAKPETNYNNLIFVNFLIELGIASRLSETRLNGLKQSRNLTQSVIMYLIEPFFKLTALENDIGQQSRLLNAIIDQWRYNGQIIGREIPLYLTEEDSEQGFAMRVICPEQDSLLPENNNQTVNLAMENAEKCGLKFQGFQIIADDLNADSTAECSQPAWQMLYTTHLQSCSPLHSGDDFSPIPL